MVNIKKLLSSLVQEFQHQVVYLIFGIFILLYNTKLNKFLVFFRTPGTGLYDNLQRYNIPYPEAIFELGYFYKNPKPFFDLAKELYPGKYFPNIIHYFIRYLFDQNLLHRVYTQNIDGLERSKSR